LITQPQIAIGFWTPKKGVVVSKFNQRENLEMDWAWGWAQGAGDFVGLVTGLFRNVLGIDPVALALALIAPVLLIYGRHEVRIRRLRTIQDFIRSFDQLGALPVQPPVQPAGIDNGAPTQAIPVTVDAEAQSAGQRIRQNPSFEFVKSKYISDIEPKRLKGLPAMDALGEAEQIDRIIESIGPFGSRADRRLFCATLGFIFVSYFGFQAVLATIVCGFGAGGCACAAGNNCAAATSTVTLGSFEQLRIIASLAFIGAYIAAIRIFLRGLSVFDLSAFSFLRQTAEVFASVAFTMVVYRAFPDPLYQMVAGAGFNPTPPASGSIPLIWLALAPLFGLLPQSVTKFLLLKLQLLVAWIKTSDDRFIPVTRIISLDIIDGIDLETRFRLEECGIYDVQNLSTYNPIMLHIESPYGIYQVIDWIAQAQLCHIVGPEKFLIFREMNIRTIFDLERAISDENSPPEFDDICVSVLFAATDTLKRTLEISKTELVIVKDGVSKGVDLKDYNHWLREKIAATDSSAATEHVMRWIADDLHVRRLRRLWKEISGSLGEDSMRLENSKK
jgi:hypothetical protein